MVIIVVIEVKDWRVFCLLSLVRTQHSVIMSRCVVVFPSPPPGQMQARSSFHDSSCLPAYPWLESSSGSRGDVQPIKEVDAGDEDVAISRDLNYMLVAFWRPS